MAKITTEHLSRSACVYIRQSTADQLMHNHESRRRQYGLAERAKQLGWTAVEVIDDDLGRSGGGIARPGFERLLAAICEGRVGAVLAIEASRLARNGRDWHTLIEFCGLVGTIIVDEDGIYDPRHPNDRLLLGMKGTMSELELSLFRQRSQEAIPSPGLVPGEACSSLYGHDGLGGTRGHVNKHSLESSYEIMLRRTQTFFST
jgi:DNA invertase Pin-like site-specific DNA recombinase